MKLFLEQKVVFGPSAKALNSDEFRTLISFIVKIAGCLLAF